MKQIKDFSEHDLPSDYEQLKGEEKETLDRWIKANLKRIATVNKSPTSYGLKHFFEASENGFYITNGMFKGAMLNAGFVTDDENVLNWHFNVSQKSVSKLYEWINNK